MPDCNIRNIDESLLRAMKAEAATQGRTLRDWCIWVFSANVGWEKPAPDPLPVIDRSETRHLKPSEALRLQRERNAMRFPSHNADDTR
jgi:hypothetical protein